MSSWPRLKQAIEKGDVSQTEILLGQDPTLANLKVYEGRTALHYGVGRHSNEKVVELLLSRMQPAMVNSVDSAGNTALHVAVGAEGMGEQAVELLLPKMSPDGIHTLNRRSCSALDIAVFRGSERMTELLLAVMSQARLDTSCVLHWTIFYGFMKGVELLLQKMSPEGISQVDEHGKSASHMAAAVGRVDILQMLLQREPNLLHALDKRFMTILHSAVESDRKEVVEFLLSKMSQEDIGAVNGSGRTALHCAAAFGHTEIAQLLLSRMSFEAINAPDINGYTALFVAVANRREKIVGLLQDKTSFEEVLTTFLQDSLAFIRKAAELSVEHCEPLWRIPAAVLALVFEYLLAGELLQPEFLSCGIVAQPIERAQGTIKLQPCKKRKVGVEEWNIVDDDVDAEEEELEDRKSVV